MTRRLILLTCLSMIFLLHPSSLTADPSGDTGKVIIAALGDSTTAGTPFYLSPLEAPPDGQGDPEGQYSYWMMHDHADWQVINLGIRGQRSDEIRTRFGDVFAYHPNYVIILAGVNDIYQGTSIRLLCMNLEWMYRETKFRNVMPIAASILPYNTASPAQNKQIEQVNQWIHEAADRHNIPFIDFHAIVADRKDPTKLNGSSDGIHPDVGGYRLMGKAVARVIARLDAARPK